MLSRYGCGCQRVRLVDDDSEDAGDALALYRGAVSPPSSVVSAVDEELLDIGHGVA